MKKILFLFLITFLSLYQTVFAEAVLHIHLFYNSTQKTITFDKTFSPTISLDKSKNIYLYEFDDKYSSPGQYELSFLDSDNIEINTIQFTPMDGSFTIDAPDYSITKTIVVQKTGSASYILKQDINQYISCNNNNICEYEKGETDLNCMSDCDNNNPKYSYKTVQLLNQGSGSISDPISGDVILKDRRSSQITETTGTITPPTNNVKQPPLNTIPTYKEQTIVNGSTPQPTQAKNRTQLTVWIVFGSLTAFAVIFLLFRRTKDTEF